MPKIKSKPTPFLKESTDSSRDARPCTPAGSGCAMGRRKTNSVIEIYALYGAALYPPPMHAVRGVSPQERTKLSCSNWTYGPGYAANDAGTNDNTQVLPPLLCERILQKSVADARWPVFKAADEPIDVINAIARCLRNVWRYIRREREIARSIALLANLEDRTLYDIGIHRSQIPHVARYGLDDSARGRLSGSR
jgi:uncharacterized protein YjiS (DUF1127 family)